MELSDIMQSLTGKGESGAEKTASANDDNRAAISDARAQVVNAIGDATADLKTNDAGESKTASQNAGEDVSGGLLKIANSLANSEQEALLKEADLVGASMADGFVQRLNQHVAAANGVPAQKTASAGVPVSGDGDLEKFAQANPELFRASAQLGYAAACEDLGVPQGQVGTKEASDETIDREKLASELEKLSETEEGREVLAHVERGYQDTIEKVASAFSQKGYEAGINMLKSLPTQNQ